MCAHCIYIIILKIWVEDADVDAVNTQDLFCTLVLQLSRPYPYYREYNSVCAHCIHITIPGIWIEDADADVESSQDLHIALIIEFSRSAESCTGPV